MDQLLDLKSDLIKICRDAGKAIMDIYQDETLFNVELKKDDSPLTQADKSANDIICRGLEELDLKYPIISEENKQLDYSIRKNYKRHWLVDPLDGTKEFIKRNGEFTVNIALIENGRTIMGFVYAPVMDELYWALKQHGSFCISNGVSEKIQVNQFNKSDENLRIVCSRSHLNDETQAFLDKYKNPDKVSKGSSLKFLLIAKGDAELYPRLAPTMEWDTAAAQCILEEAGGSVINAETGKALNYNKENLLNPHFIASGKQLEN